MDVDRMLASFDPPTVLRIGVWLLVVALVTVIALRLAQRFVDGVVARALTRPLGDDTRGQLSVLEFEKRRRTLQALVGNLARIVILGIAAMAVLASSMSTLDRPSRASVWWGWVWPWAHRDWSRTSWREPSSLPRTSTAAATS